MNIVILLAGIVDPKWPLTFTADGRPVQNKKIFSPFDEAALEVGLKLRDLQPGAKVTVMVPGGPESEPLLRRAAAFRPDRLVQWQIDLSPDWDPGRVARQIKAGLRDLGTEPGLVLMGREFGDWDDGTLPPCLAEELGRSFFGLCQYVRKAGAAPALVRESMNTEEWIELAPALLTSVTNDRRNRLRHPLMKNVMAARSAPIDVLQSSAGTGEAPAAGFGQRSVVLAEPASRETSCRILTGPLPSQAAELATYLRRRR